MENEPLGTAGPIKLAEKFLSKKSAVEPDFFIVMNSDIVCDFPLQEMIKFHKEKKSLITLMVTRIESDFQRFGVVLSDQNSGQIKQFIEKP